MAHIRSALLAAVCLQLLLLLAAGQQLLSTPAENYGLCAAGGLRQSPVNIRSEGLKEVKMEPLIFEQYNVPFVTEIGYRDFRVVPQYTRQEQVPVVRGGNLPGIYRFEKLHFHWGPEGEQGSEHLLDGRQYDAEMHVVHVNEKYGNINEALKRSDGLASFAIWLKAEDRYSVNKYSSNNNGYQWMKSLANLYLSVPEENLKGFVQNNEDGTGFFWNLLALRDILPLQPNEFFRYNGSLTINTCSESVTWTVFRSPIIVPREFMTMLRHKEASVRAPQPLNNRTILYGRNMMTYYTGAGLATTPSRLWTLPPLLAVLKMAL